MTETFRLMQLMLPQLLRDSAPMRKYECVPDGLMRTRTAQRREASWPEATGVSAELRILGLLLAGAQKHLAKFPLRGAMVAVS
jgi:hypothetical protein